MSKESFNAITGDVVVTTDVTVNTKGGSMTATLKKSLREKLGESGGRLLAATMEFATGQSIVLLSGSSGTAELNAPVHVRRIGRNRFEVELQTGEDEEIDEVTAAFLRLKKDQFEKGKLQLTAPVTASGWRVAVADKFHAADVAMRKVTEGGRRG